MSEQQAAYDVSVESNTTGRATTGEHWACPFCNCAAVFLPCQEYGLWNFRIWCKTCNTKGDLYATEAQAWHAWDTRAAAATRDRDIRALFEELLGDILAYADTGLHGSVAAIEREADDYRARLNALLGGA